MADALTDISWFDLAGCAGMDTEMFFPDSEDLAGIAAAKAVCAACPVGEDCLAFAIETNQSEGIWGGLTSRQRRRLRSGWLQRQRQAS